MIYPQSKFFTCFSPRIKNNLEEFGYSPETEYKDIKTDKLCWVYKRTNELNMYLGMTKYNAQNNLGYMECQIFKLIHEDKLFPNTDISQYDIRPIVE